MFNALIVSIMIVCPIPGYHRIIDVIIVIISAARIISGRRKNTPFV